MLAVISRSELLPSASGERSPNGRVQTPSLQRSFGRADLTFVLADGVSRASRVYQQGAMKVRFPRMDIGEPPEAVLINTSGGLTGGDVQSVSVAVEAGASAVITTQACERVYRSSGDDALVNADLSLGAGAHLYWLPQPLIFFDRGRLRRETHVELSCDAILLAVESVVFGRLASGETVRTGSISDAWFVRRAGRLTHAERFVADGPIDSLLDKPATLAGNRAMALIRYIAPNAVARLEEMRVLLGSCACEAAASAWNGMLLARLLAPDAYDLNRELLRIMSAFTGKPLPKVWLL